MEKKIAFIGFGEAAYYIAAGLNKKGFHKMVAFDICMNDEHCGAIIRANAKEAGVPLCKTAKEAVEQSGFIVSLTSAKVALKVAESVLPLMKKGQILYDFNSASPMTKQEIGMIPRPLGVNVCDVAVMASVPLKGSEVPLLLAGEGAEEFFAQMKVYGMRMEVLDAPLGAASAVKMIRSIFMKGYPQILLECLMAAETYGVTEKILDSLENSVGGKTVRQLANQLLTPTIIHAARRSSEMKEVVLMLQNMKLEASMSQAAQLKLDNLARLKIETEIGLDSMPDYKDLIPMILQSRKYENAENK